MMDDPMNPELLISHADGLRRLSRRLVYGDAAVDDVVQETYLAALSVPPASVKNPAAWLRGVARNVARGSQRRAARQRKREQVAAKPEAQADPTALVATVDEHARVLDAVRRLAEPYRAVVILRYLQELAPAEIAERRAIPLATVKTQLKRGLHKVREDLDRSHGGDRRAWCMALLGLPRDGLAAAGAATATGVIMKKFVLAGLLVLLCAGVLWFADPLGLWPSGGDPTDGSPMVVSEGREDDNAPELMGAGPTATTETPDPSLQPKATSVAQGTGPRLVGRVVDETGKPVPHALVWLDRKAPTGLALWSGANGRFVLRVKPGKRVLYVRGSGTGTTHLEVDVAAGVGALPVPDMVVTKGGVIRGQVLDVDGKPRQFVRVRCWAVDPDSGTELGRGGTRYLIGGDDVATGPDGRFELKGLADEPHRVYVDLFLAPMYRSVPAEFPDVRPGREPLTFRVLPKNHVTGRVVDAETGAVIPTFSVNNVPVTHPDGYFSIAADGGGAFTVKALGYRPYRNAGLALQEGESARDLRIEMEPDPDTGTIVIVAEDDTNSAATGWTASGFGPKFNFWSATCEASDGRLRVRGLAPGKQAVDVRGDGWADAKAQITVVAGAETVVRITLRRGGRVRLTVKNEAGEVPRFAKLLVKDAKGQSVPFRFTYAKPQGTSIIVTETASFGQGATSLSIADGMLRGVPAGTYVLHLYVKGAVRQIPITVPPKGEVRVTSNK